MSHEVDPQGLDGACAPYGRSPFLLYANTDANARVNHVVVASISGPAVTISGFGRGIAKRITADDTTPLSLLWPPHEDGGYSLIADGTGEVSSDGEQLTITVHAAVLHRPAPVDGQRSC